MSFYLVRVKPKNKSLEIIEVCVLPILIIEPIAWQVNLFKTQSF